MSNDLINRVTQQLKQASNDSTTPAGQTEPHQAPSYSDEQVAAINQLFELFRFNYHNQFLKAFPDLDTLNMAKRLWLKLLSDYHSEAILKAAEKTVRESQFLPNIHDVLTHCEQADVYGLPHTHAAYVEACRAPSPKSNFNWSHPAVYYAGRASDWYFLSTTTQAQALPVFERNYEVIKSKLHHGETLGNIPKALSNHIVAKPLSSQKKRESLAKIRALFK